MAPTGLPPVVSLEEPAPQPAAGAVWGVHTSTGSFYHDTEKQLTKALSKMAKAVTSPPLRAAFESHLQETRGQIERLEQAFQRLDEGQSQLTGRHAHSGSTDKYLSKQAIPGSAMENLDLGESSGSPSSVDRRHGRSSYKFAGHGGKNTRSG